MTYSYKTKGTCSTQIDLELDGNVVHNVKFTGGCNGNLQAIPKLVEGLTRGTGGRKNRRHPLWRTSYFLRRPACKSVP